VHASLATANSVQPGLVARSQSVVLTLSWPEALPESSAVVAGSVLQTLNKKEKVVPGAISYPGLKYDVKLCTAEHAAPAPHLTISALIAVGQPRLAPKDALPLCTCHSRNVAAQGRSCSGAVLAATTTVGDCVDVRLQAGRWHA
jgi:hypothetical protein